MEALLFGTLEAHPALSRSQHQQQPVHAVPNISGRAVARAIIAGTSMHSTPLPQLN